MIARQKASTGIDFDICSIEIKYDRCDCYCRD